jgi:hypothetical protein
MTSDMPHSVESIFDNPSVERHREIDGEHRFFLAEIDVEIAIRVTKRRDDPLFYFAQSHFIKTPQQMSPYRTSRPWSDTYERALHQAVQGMVSNYDSAREAGLHPSASWLIENDQFPDL